LSRILIIGLGGFLGAIARYAVTAALGARAFPWGTLAVNVLGCLAIGATIGWIEARPPVGAYWRPFVTIGLLGSFTTFSTFGLETVELARNGQGRAAMTYVAASLFIGLGAVVAGRWAAVVAAR